jgi:hypothetical protein
MERLVDQLPPPDSGPVTLEGQMSASVRTVPAQAAGWGRFPTAFAALALVVILAVMVAIVALNGTKASTPATTSGFGHGPGDWYYTTTTEVGAPPAGYDHGSSSGELKWAPSLIPSHGGFGGPRLTEPGTSGGFRGPGLRAQ